MSSEAKAETMGECECEYSSYDHDYFHHGKLGSWRGTQGRCLGCGKAVRVWGPKGEDCRTCGYWNIDLVAAKKFEGKCPSCKFERKLPSDRVIEAIEGMQDAKRLSEIHIQDAKRLRDEALGLLIQSEQE